MLVAGVLEATCCFATGDFAVDFFAALRFAVVLLAGVRDVLVAVFGTDFAGLVFDLVAVAGPRLAAGLAAACLLAVLRGVDLATAFFVAVLFFAGLAAEDRLLAALRTSDVFFAALADFAVVFVVALFFFATTFFTARFFTTRLVAMPASGERIRLY